MLGGLIERKVVIMVVLTGGWCLDRVLILAAGAGAGMLGGGGSQ